MSKIIQAEWLKIKRTTTMYMVIVLPIIYSTLLFLYCKSTEANRGNAALYTNYLLFFELLNFAIIVVSAIVISLDMENEYRSNRFNFILSRPRRGYYLLSKYVFYFNILVWTLVISTSVYLGLFALTSTYPIEWYVAVLKTSLIQLLCHGAYLSMYMFLSFKGGVVPTVGLSIFGMILAAILGATPLGTNLWPVIPFGWGMKGIEFVSSNNSLLLLLIIISALFLVITMLILSLWFSRWEGRKNSL